MSARACVDEQEYLSTSYEWEPEWVEGELRERGLPNLYHSTVQQNVSEICMRLRLVGTPLNARPQLRIRTLRGYRIPDVSIFLGNLPRQSVPEFSPQIVVEIISPDDAYHDVYEKFHDYAETGIRHIWVIDPQARSTSVFRNGGTQLVDVYAVPESGIEIPAAEFLEGLPANDAAAGESPSAA